VPPSSVEVPFLPQTPVLAVSRAQFGFPEDQATSQTRPVNSQGVGVGSDTGRCSAKRALLQCVRGVFVVDSDAKTRKNALLGALAPNGGRWPPQIIQWLICIQRVKCQLSSEFLAWSQYVVRAPKLWSSHLRCL
jgi:hypothetical protein